MRSIWWPICLIFILPLLLIVTALEVLFYDEAKQDVKALNEYLKRRKDE